MRYIPAISLLVVLTISLAPLSLLTGTLPLPLLAAYPAWFWSLHQRMTPWLLFAAGVSLDMLNATVLGFHPLNLFAFALMAAFLRPFLLHKPPLLVWGTFAPVALLGETLAWMLLGTPSFTPFLLRALLMVALYPLAHSALTYLHTLRSARTG